ncbi:MAG: metal-dependent hydrolase [Verrucomicrobiales bacterium]|jgi:L-ascorbate metabolism protein UlaG (beta-lactamase superfamily)|nr:metal-dependent hydrolase [Verrucomicrobiales bacterium]
MKLTYFGHSCFAVEAAGKTLLFDPFITPNPLAAHLDIDSIKADYILLSHGHADHVADAVAIARRTGATVIATFEVANWAAAGGAPKVRHMNHGGKAVFDFGTVKLTNAVHSSSLPDGSYGGHPAGFLVTVSDGAFYYSGDTALTCDMRLIGEAAKLKFAVLPIGDNFTMGCEDALTASDFIRCDDIVGVHYDTFPPIKIDQARAVEFFRQANKTLRLPAIGDSVVF